jgi:eukaryotic-like serine/threonine-protein kinase
LKIKCINVNAGLIKRSLWVNILLALGLSLLILFLFFQTMEFWTNHGEYLRVPDVKGKDYKEAADLLDKAGFDVVVQDSVYYDSLSPLVIIKQFPDPDATVKVNRTIYLTINRATAPLINMPNLVGMSFRNAELEMRAKGLKLGDTMYVPDIAKNAVKDQLLGSVSLKPGTPVAMGTSISLVLGAGIGNEDISVPDLFGMPYSEALTLLESNGIILGVVLPDNDLTDTLAGFVYWQNPERINEERKINRIRTGQMMDIKLSVIKPERKTDSTLLSPEPSIKNDY